MAFLLCGMYDFVYKKIKKIKKGGFSRKLRGIQGSLTFRLYSIQIANAIFWCCGLTFNVFIINVFTTNIFRIKMT